MSEKQPGSGLGQTPELSLYPEQMLRKGLGLVLSDLVVMVALCGSGLPGCRLHLSPQVWWSPASTCQLGTFISTLLLIRAPAAGLQHASSCLVTLRVFPPPPPRRWGHVLLPSPF